MGSHRQKSLYFFKDKPLFGLDIGNGSLKVMQTVPDKSEIVRGQSAKTLKRLIGYGNMHFDPRAIQDGVITQPDIIAEAAMKLFSGRLIGDITTRRVAMTIPSYRTFIRSITLPKLKPKDLAQAVEMEIEQYTPIALDKLYWDYEFIRNTSNEQELLAVAIPKDIVDSYLELAAIMGLEPVMLEPTMSAAARLFLNDYQSDVPTVIIDFGSLSSDISIFDHQLITSGTVQGGGEIFTKSIVDSLQVTPAEAHIIKTRYGLGVSKRQKEIRSGLEPVLNQIIKEIRRLIRYYEEHYGTDKPINQLIVLGGGGNIPGLNEYLIDNLRLAVRPCDPWQYITTDKLHVPPRQDKLMYATVAGLSMTEPKKVFVHD